ncbi:hypothetical protein [Prosthecobacter sp.]|uniref:hypothetical protein n=1 Tax=Prosthecobacter sp. TaxID=1965333 RepID=UPI0037851BE0
MTDAEIRTADIRLDVLNALYARRTGAHQADTIRTVFLRNRDYTLEEVKTALSDLERFHRVQHSFESDMSAIELWQITGDGITFKERGGR